jgi:hypothetical protein
MTQNTASDITVVSFQTLVTKNVTFSTVLITLDLILNQFLCTSYQHLGLKPNKPSLLPCSTFKQSNHQVTTFVTKFLLYVLIN